MEVPLHSVATGPAGVGARHPDLPLAEVCPAVPSPDLVNTEVAAVVVFALSQQHRPAVSR